MQPTAPNIDTLVSLLDASSRPIYALNAEQQIVYCNRALAAWVGLARERIVGRSVEYHSELVSPEEAASRPPAAPLTDLCPPPRALAGVPCNSTVGCVGSDGRLVHRQAEFIPLTSTSPPSATRDGNPSAAGHSGGEAPGGVLVVLSAVDMTPQQIADELSGEPASDELHRAIRRFRHHQKDRYGAESLLGESSGMRKVRAQVAAAAASHAHVLVRGRPGSGRSHVARAIHYQSAADVAGPLVPLDCEVAGEDLLRRTLDAGHPAEAGKRRPTLLLWNLDRLPEALQSQLAARMAARPLSARVIATISTPPRVESRREEPEERPDPLDPQLLDALSTITIDVPPLIERREDLPLLAQCFLEGANRGHAKQVGSVRPEALDLLALYRWPGELDELREVIAAAHAVCGSHQIVPADLPAVIHHAASAAALPRRFTERIVLDELLATIEREVIMRAMERAGGNKSAAAELLGMTRPRLYRRLVQLGLAGDSADGSGP